VEPSSTRVRVALGFGHWFGSTVGSPKGISTPALGIGVRPGVSFLEVRVEYALSIRELDLPSSNSSRVGFAVLELVANKEMRVGDQTLNAHVGPLGVLVHAGSRVGGGFGLVIGAEYLFNLALAFPSAIGVFVHAREVFYRLGPERTTLTTPEAQIDLGVVATAF